MDRTDESAMGESIERRAVETLHALARLVAEGHAIEFTEDWGLGSATVAFDRQAHTHIGVPAGFTIEDSEQKSLDDFIESLHALLVKHRGLSLASGEG